jgi:hypothetical protein
VIILGNSYAYFGLNPEYFKPKTFNAGYLSQSLNYDFEIFKKYRESFEKLHTVVIPITYSSLFRNLENTGEIWRTRNYRLYFDIDLNDSYSLIDNFEILNNKLFVNLIRLNSVYLKGEAITCNELGWGYKYTSDKARDLVTSGRVAISHTVDMSNEEIIKVYNYNTSVLDSITNWCYNRNIKVVFLTLPAYKTYRENIKVEQYTLMQESIQSIVSKFNNSLYINLFEDESFQKIDFYDADHLSDIGAKKLSLMIDSLLFEKE